MKLLTNIITLPFFAGAILAAVLLFILPDYFAKYKAVITSIETFMEDRNVIFDDLDGDSVSERIMSLHHKDEMAVVMIDKEGRVFPEIDFQGKYLGDNQSVFTGDFDKDGFSEIYTVTLFQDTAWLWIRKPMQNKGYTVSRRFISPVCRYKDRTDCRLVSIKVADMNKDGLGDLVFALNTGWCLSPRKVYVYSIIDDSLIESPESAAGIFDFEIVNDNGNNFIILSTTASGNCPDTAMAYSDSSSWLQVLDHKLNFVFRPVEFKAYYSKLYNKGIYIDGKLKLLSVLDNYGLSGQNNIMKLFSMTGVLIKNIEFPVNGKRYGICPFIGETGSGHNLVLVSDVGGFAGLNADFDTVRQLISNGLEKNKLILETDADGDGNKELMIIGRDGRSVSIVRNDLSDVTTLELPIQLSGGFCSSISYSNSGEHIVYLNAGKDLIGIHYSKNRWYWLKYPFYLGVFLLSGLFVFLIQHMARVQIQRRIKSDRKIREIQLKALQNQLDPHFTFNVMNTISAAALKGETQQAYDLTVNFSGMIRASLMNAGSVTRSLGDEIEFVRKYVDIEKERMNFPLEYNEDISPGIDLSIPVPKMIIQVFAENAIKHGLKPMDRPGCLKVKISKERSALILIIEDDGIGRKAARENPVASTGKGLSLIEELISTFNKYNKEKISLQITDLADSEVTATGTRVSIEIPLDYRFELA